MVHFGAVYELDGAFKVGLNMRRQNNVALRARRHKLIKGVVVANRLYFLEVFESGESFEVRLVLNEAIEAKFKQLLGLCVVVDVGQLVEEVNCGGCDFEFLNQLTKLLLFNLVHRFRVTVQARKLILNPLLRSLTLRIYAQFRLGGGAIFRADGGAGVFEGLLGWFALAEEAGNGDFGFLYYGVTLLVFKPQEILAILFLFGGTAREYLAEDF